MNRAQLDPIAEILKPAYLETQSFRVQFRETHGYPATLALKVHHFRCVVQGMTVDSDRFSLGEAFTELSRVEIIDDATERHYLLRSKGAVTIEQAKRKQREALFDATTYIASNVVLLIYRFHLLGLDLAVAGTEHRSSRKRLEASGLQTHVGTWPWTTTDGTSPFDEGIDKFDDLDIDIDDEGKEQT